MTRTNFTNKKKNPRNEIISACGVRFEKGSSPYEANKWGEEMMKFLLLSVIDLQSGL